MGHTDIPFIRVVNQVTVIKPGAVSNPLVPDLRASYALLDADRLGWTVQHRRVVYDHAAVIAVVERSQHPAANFIIDHQLGNRTIAGMLAAANARRHMINQGESD